MKSITTLHLETRNEESGSSGYFQSCPTEWFHAFCTLVSLLSRVCQQMFPQICSFTEWFFVLTTFVWLLARVSPQVSPLNNSLDWMSCCIVHSAHLCFFSPLWMSKWVLRFPAQLNDFTHCAHLWAFSPECASTCFLRSVVSLNYFLHRVHLCRFRVCLQASPQMRNLSEWFVAFSTPVSLLSTVSPQISRYL